MYKLWEEKRISKPSEYWNMALGDKLVTRVFFEKHIADKNEKRRTLKNNKTLVFPVDVI